MASVETLLQALRNRGTAQARDLMYTLKVSQPTLSRLIRHAGDRIYRIGKGRATRYALTREIPGLGTHLPVYQVDETGKTSPYGQLHLLASPRTYLAYADVPGKLYESLPPFAWDMSPQGYLGREFSTYHPELLLPPRIRDWNDDQRLIALARRGEDCVGNLILGDESLTRYLARTLQPRQRSEYTDLAHHSQSRDPGSSAGGEQPKFTAYSAKTGHVLVKFASMEDSPVAQRWRDLLLSEHVALQALRNAGIEAAQSAWFDGSGYRFLEIQRFDRVRERGRKGMLSLYAMNTEYLGVYPSWTNAALQLRQEPHIDTDPRDLERMIWLDTFGQLIGNTDRHFGNLSFFTDSSPSLGLRLAPVYDMLPMLFAPTNSTIIDRTFAPQPPTAANHLLWLDAAQHALGYWETLASFDAISFPFRELCLRCRSILLALVDRA
jgi:hypothetical protein